MPNGAYPSHAAWDEARKTAKTEGCKCYWDSYSWTRDAKVNCPIHGVKEAAAEERSTGGRNPPPEHYEGSIEPWDYIAAHGLDFWAGNVIKYVTRAGRKSNALVDYVKARDYLNYLIAREEAE